MSLEFRGFASFYEIIVFVLVKLETCILKLHKIIDV